MKAIACLVLATMMAAGMSLFSACGSEGQTPSANDAQAAIGAVLPEADPEKERAPASDEEKRAPEETSEAPAPDGEAPAPEVSPLAALEAVRLDTAFGDPAEAEWAYALQVAAALSAGYSFRLMSELSGKEKFYAGLAAEVTLADTLGIRASENSPLGFDLFGGGTAGLAFSYTCPKSDAAPTQKNYEAGFYHDGDLIWYAREGEKKSIDISAVSSYLAAAAGSEVYARIIEAAETIPAELEKGLSLRVGVEKLIDLGFAVAIDDSAGLTVHITAGKGFFTDLLNDALEQFLPAEWLKYIPRADFRYTSTDLDITVAFDEKGLFREYTVQNDVALGLSLEVRGLFLCESTVQTGGSFSVTALDEVPAHWAEDEGDGAL